MNKDLDEVIQHAVMANFDGDLKGVMIVMLNGDGLPEIHFSMPTSLAFEMNAGLDIAKLDIIEMMKSRMEQRKARE